MTRKGMHFLTNREISIVMLWWDIPKMKTKTKMMTGDEVENGSSDGDTKGHQTGIYRAVSLLTTSIASPNSYNHPILGI